MKRCFSHSRQYSRAREKVLQIASYAHMYVFELENQIVGVGAISSFWGSETESILLTIFVLPELHGKGIGRIIIQALEQDEFFIRANRIEIPASITASLQRSNSSAASSGAMDLSPYRSQRIAPFSFWQRA